MNEIIFLSDILLSSIALVWVIIATTQDIRKREVANWLNFSLVIIALGIRGIAAIISLQYYYILYGFLLFLISFIVGNMLYYARVFAGGDAKLLIALSVTFATTPTFIKIHKLELFSLPLFVREYFLFRFIINLFFIGSLYGIVWSIVLAMTNRERVYKKLKNVIRKNKNLFMLFFIFSLLFFLAYILVKNIAFFIIGTVLLIFPYFFLFVRTVDDVCMIKYVRCEELSEGEWIAKPLKLKIKNREIIIKPQVAGLSRKDIEFIKKAKVKKILVKQGIPFVPVFLISLITSFFFNLLILSTKFFSRF